MIERAAPARDDQPEPPPIDRRDLWAASGLALLAALLYFATRPAVVNSDGLGYIKLLPHNFAAGHLAYMPLLRLAAFVLRDGLRAGLALSAVAGGVAVGLCYGCARALADRFASVVAACGLAVSYGVWVQGSDVEIYALALAALLALFAVALAYRARPSPARALAVGVALGWCVLLHLTHVLITPFVFFWIASHAPSRRRALTDGVAACAAGGGLAIAGYAWAALGVRRLDLHGALAWIGTASHGFHYGGGIKQRLGDACYGLAKAFVWSPYLYESDAQTLLSQFLLGLAPLACVLSVIALRRRALPARPARLLALWAAPYAAMALAFFGSDHERWVFVLPPLWLAAGAAIARLSRARAIATCLVAYLAFVNAATAINPARHDPWTRTRADDAAALMRDGDLVIFPGHSWDEYVGFYTRTRVVPFPVAYYWARDGRERCLQRMDKEIALARQRGARIFALRIFDDESDSRGFFELAELGLDRAELRALFDRFRAVPLATVEPKVTVWRLDDPP